MTRIKLILLGLLASLLIVSVYVFLPKTKLEKIQQRGTLRVLTRIDPTTYFQNAGSYSGLEYDLVNLFSESIGVKAEFEVPATFPKILEKIARGEADIAAAGLTVTEQRKQHMQFAPPYHNVTEQLIYQSRHHRPQNLSDLSKGILEVGEGTSHLDSLNQLKKRHSGLTWVNNNELDTNGLLYLVHEGLIDYTVADSNQVVLIRRFYPDLNIAFNISKPKPLAWALSKSDDTSLADVVNKFFKRIKADKTLAQLIEKHYGHAASLNYVDNCTFREHKRERLPAYQKHFVNAASKHDLDWRLLAAIGYQESHWLDNAVSPTGVEGIMMLTNDTADLLDIKNRRDPVASIYGGARYFRQRIKAMSDKIPEPDRTWFALASYNVGTGHLEDARLITKKQGGDPDKWMDVKKRLPLLSDPKWYAKTEFGQARGNEPVQYVENIRGYYDLLVWLTEENQIKKNALGESVKTVASDSAEILPPAVLF